MINKKQLFLILIVLLSSIFPSFAQQKSSDKVTIDGISYFLHKVNKKESLYAISKLYDVDANDIRIANPTMGADLKSGKTIKVPIFDKNYTYHSIEKGETLYSIAKYYEIDENIIIKENPTTSQSLRAGELLKIPKLRSDNITVIEPDNTDNPGDITSVIKRVDNPCGEFTYEGQAFKVALLLPLYLKENADLTLVGSDEKKRIKYFSNSKIFIDYYQGTLIALDSLSKLGISIELHVYDTENNPEKVKQIASKPEILTMDLIIGPIYSKNIKILAEKLSGKSINMVSPLDSKDSLTSNISNLFHVNSSNLTRIEKMAEYINKIENNNIIIVHSDTFEEREQIITLEKTLKLQNDSELKKVYFKKNSEVYGIQSKLDITKNNIIIVTSNNEVVVTNLMSQLSKLNERFVFAVFGSRKWETFSNMDFEYYSKLNIIYHSSTFEDNLSLDRQKFEKKCNAIFNQLPTEYTEHGFDVMYYFGNLLKTYGKQFDLCLNSKKEKVDALHTYFDFEKLENGAGFENKNVYLIRYNDDFFARKIDTDKKHVFTLKDE